MRRLGFVAALAVFSLALLPTSAFADNEVLVPSDTQTSEPAPNPVLAPAQDNSAEGAADLGLVPSYKKNDAKNSLMPNTDFGFVDTEDKTNYTPVPRGRPNLTDQSTTNVIKVPSLDPGMSKPVTNDPDVTPPAGGDDLAIDISDKFVWGPNDVATVTRGLGLSADNVKSHCHIAISGLIMTDKTVATIMMSPYILHTVVNMPGKPTSINITATALCDVEQLPQNLGLVMQIGDKYSVFMAPVNCSPPPEGAHHMGFTYLGDGKGTCQYQ